MRRGINKYVRRIRAAFRFDRIGSFKRMRGRPVRWQAPKLSSSKPRDPYDEYYKAVEWEERQREGAADSDNG